METLDTKLKRKQEEFDKIHMVGMFHREVEQSWESFFDKIY